MDTEHVDSLSRELLRVESYAELIELVREDLLPRVGLTHAWLYVFQRSDDQHFRLVSCAGPRAALIRELAAVLPRAGDVMLDQLLREQRPIVIADAQLGPYPEVTRQLRNRTVVNVPISVVDHPLGVMGCGTFDAEGVVEIGETELHYLVQLAQVVSVAVARIVFIERARRR